MSRVQSGCDGFSSRIDRLYMRIKDDKWKRFKDVDLRIYLAQFSNCRRFLQIILLRSMMPISIFH
jgi:hypothetical protein